RYDVNARALPMIPSAGGMFGSTTNDRPRTFPFVSVNDSWPTGLNPDTFGNSGRPVESAAPPNAAPRPAPAPNTVGNLPQFLSTGPMAVAGAAFHPAGAAADSVTTVDAIAAFAAV